MLDRQLAGVQRRLAARAVIEHFEQIRALGLADGGQREIIENEQSIFASCCRWWPKLPSPCAIGSSWRSRPNRV
jgi:hypothetical protein